jgi:hypothetical protein
VLCGTLASCRTGRPYLAFIDKSGQVRIRLQPSQDARSFAEGLAAVSVNGKWGFINSGGQFVIPAKFGSVDDFSEGLALVTPAPADEYWNKNTLFGYINTSGQYVIPPRFNWALSFSDGLAPVCTGPCRNKDLPKARIGYIDRNGRYVLPAHYGHGCRFSEGLACASLDAGLRALQGFIDRSGEFVIKPRFTWASEFSNGLAATNDGFITHRGDVVIARQPANQLDGFSGDWAAVLDGDGKVFVDAAGRVTLRPNCEGVGAFSEDLAPACSSNCGPSALGPGQNWGYMDRTGMFVIKPQFGYTPRPFRNGLALVCFGCRG